MGKNKEPIQGIKCVVVGDYAGNDNKSIKTTMLMSYITGTIPDYIPAVFDNHSTTVVIDGESTSLSLWDTSGGEENDSLRPKYYSQTDVFVLVFSLVILGSFQNISDKWYPEISRYCPNAAIILAGSELELRNDPAYLKELTARELQPITYEQGCMKAKEIKARKYLEFSSRTQQGLKEVFDEAVRAVLYPPVVQQKKRRRACLIM